MNNEILKLQKKIQELEYCSFVKEDFEVLKSEIIDIKKQLHNLISQNKEILVSLQKEKNTQECCEKNNKFVLIVIGLIFLSIGLVISTIKQ